MPNHPLVGQFLQGKGNQGVEYKPDIMNCRARVGELGSHFDPRFKLKTRREYQKPVT